MEVEGVEAGAQVAALFFVPDEGRAVVAEVAGEGGDVVGSVGEAEDVVADEAAGGGVAEVAVVVGGGDDREVARPCTRSDGYLGPFGEQYNQKRMLFRFAKPARAALSHSSESSFMRGS